MLVAVRIPALSTKVKTMKNSSVPCVVHLMRVGQMSSHETAVVGRSRALMVAVRCTTLGIDDEYDLQLSMLRSATIKQSPKPMSSALEDDK